MIGLLILARELVRSRDGESFRPEAGGEERHVRYSRSEKLQTAESRAALLPTTQPNRHAESHQRSEGQV
jgi:hypothetical protein